MFLLNVLLALAWAALTGQFTPTNFAFGFALGFLALWLARRSLNSKGYFGQVGRVIWFVLFFIWELVLSNLRVAAAVLAPRVNLRPAIVAIPLDLRSDAQITLLANMITLTPGTLSLDVSDDGRTLYVHCIDITTADVLRRDIKQGFEQAIIKTFGT